MVTLLVIELSFIACPALNFDGFEAILVEACYAILENNANCSYIQTTSSRVLQFDMNATIL